MPGQLTAGVFYAKGLHVQRGEENQFRVPLSSTSGEGLGNVLDGHPLKGAGFFSLLRPGAALPPRRGSALRVGCNMGP